jgi:hypothetical protein
MAENDLEKEVKQIRKDSEALNKKLDFLVDESKERDSIRGTFKGSYQLFCCSFHGSDKWRIDRRLPKISYLLVN